MSRVIDIHVHVFPDPLKRLPLIAGFEPALKEIRKRARSWIKPYAKSLHAAHVALRHLPEPARRGVDEVSALLPLPSLLLESTSEDLLEVMQRTNVSRSLLIASPPYSSNDFILELSRAHPSFSAAVNIPDGTPKAGALLKKYIRKGAKCLKIHPAMDGSGPESGTYAELLKVASERDLPVILHTGCTHSHLFYRKPRMGEVSLYEPWFTAYPDTTFVLAHMNMHEPQRAIDLAEEHRNVRVDTSWQPAEIIGEAVRRLGAHKVLFGSDWPLVGHNIGVSIKRIEDCVRTGMFGQAEADRVLGENAAELLRVN